MLQWLSISRRVKFKTTEQEYKTFLGYLSSSFPNVPWRIRTSAFLKYIVISQASWAVHLVWISLPFISSLYVQLHHGLLWEISLTITCTLATRPPSSRNTLRTRFLPPLMACFALVFCVYLPHCAPGHLIASVFVLVSFKSRLKSRPW